MSNSYFFVCKIIPNQGGRESQILDTAEVCLNPEQRLFGLLAYRFKYPKPEPGSARITLKCVDLQRIITTGKHVCALTNILIQVTYG